MSVVNAAILIDAIEIAGEDASHYVADPGERSIGGYDSRNSDLFLADTMLTVGSQALKMGDEVMCRLVAEAVARHCGIESVPRRIDAGSHCPDDCVNRIRWM